MNLGRRKEKVNKKKIFFLTYAGADDLSPTLHSSGQESKSKQILYFVE